MNEWFVTKGSMWHGAPMCLHHRKIFDLVVGTALAVCAGVLEPAGTNGTTFVSWSEFGALPCEVNSLRETVKASMLRLLLTNPRSMANPCRANSSSKQRSSVANFHARGGCFQRSQSNGLLFSDDVCWARALTDFGLK